MSPQQSKRLIKYLIRELLDFMPESHGTDLAVSLEFLTSAVKKRCTAFLMSDFIDSHDYKNALTIANRKHDVVAIQVYDKRMEELPNIGLMKVRDAENGEIMYIDSSSRIIRNSQKEWWNTMQEKKNDFMTRSRVDSTSVRTDQDYVKALMGLFAIRNCL